MVSKTKIKERMKKKLNPELAETIFLAQKNKGWLEVARRISAPTRTHVSINLDEIEADTETGDTVVIPGKVLSRGNLSKKVRVVSLAISEAAKEKLKESKSEYATIKEEIKKNPKAQGVKILL